MIPVTTVSAVDFCDVMPYSLVCSYQHFRQTYHFNLQISILKTEAILCCETMVTTYKIT